MWVLTSPDARKAHELSFNTAHCASIFCCRFAPISEVIVAEAKSTLPDRLETIHVQVQATLERGTNSLDLVVTAIHDAWNSQPAMGHVFSAC